MTDTPLHNKAQTTRLPVAAIRRSGGSRAEICPDADWRAALAAELSLDALRKLRMQVEITPIDGGLSLTGHLGATVVQPCVVTLAPVSTRIETELARTYLQDLPEPEAEELELPEEDTPEPLGAVLDLAALLAEVLMLNVPQYPRADGAEFGEESYTEDGVAPIKDEDLKPFAGLQGLKDQLKTPQGE